VPFESVDRCTGPGEAHVSWVIERAGFAAPRRFKHRARLAKPSRIRKKDGVESDDRIEERVRAIVFETFEDHCCLMRQDLRRFRKPARARECGPHFGIVRKACRIARLGRTRNERGVLQIGAVHHPQRLRCFVDLPRLQVALRGSRQIVPKRMKARHRDQGLLHFDCMPVADHCGDQGRSLESMLRSHPGELKMPDQLAKRRFVRSNRENRIELFGIEVDTAGSRVKRLPQPGRKMRENLPIDVVEQIGECLRLKFLEGTFEISIACELRAIKRGDRPTLRETHDAMEQRFRNLRSSE
jgi:hypothetical protein